MASHLAESCPWNMQSTFHILDNHADARIFRGLPNIPVNPSMQRHRYHLGTQACELQGMQAFLAAFCIQLAYATPPVCYECILSDSKCEKASPEELQNCAIPAIVVNF